MQIVWTSQQGQQREQNSDALALGYTGSHTSENKQYLVATLVDAAEKSSNGRLITGSNPHGERLAYHWAYHCTNTILQSGSHLNTEQLISQLAERQKTLRQYFLHDIASYGVLVLNTRNGEFQWLYTGDCRIGIAQQSDIHRASQEQEVAISCDWLNTPHRLADAAIYQQAQALEALETPKNTVDRSPQAQPQTLTQTLNARRFYTPVTVSAKLKKDQTLLLATDGYWYEHLHKGIALGKTEDDASMLSIQYHSYSEHAIEQSTDTANCHAFTASDE